MSMPYYVAPEQMMKDRADFARKGIARGKSLVALQYNEGIAIIAENPSNTLRKSSEIYDRIAFAGVGKYNEFDSLRVLGVRSADLKGYQFSREDVDARSLANQYAQIIGQTFTHEVKPLEVEILVAELGITSAEDQLFHIMYDGTVIDEKPFIVIGGDTDTIKSKIAAAFKTDLTLKESCNLARTALSSDERTLQASDLEVTLLQRNGSRRCFKRITEDALAALLN
ncbi:proteasome subunit alpha [Actinomycetes bacterium]|nr:proteasome subunit alpha [Actinomycetes bacterium]